MTSNVLFFNCTFRARSRTEATTQKEFPVRGELKEMNYRWIYSWYHLSVLCYNFRRFQMTAWDFVFQFSLGFNTIHASLLCYIRYCKKSFSSKNCFLLDCCIFKKTFDLSLENGPLKKRHHFPDCEVLVNTRIYICHL